MKNKIKMIIISIILIVLDIIIKLIISNKLIFNQSIKIIDNFFYITYVKNTGVAWSMLNNKVSLIVLITFLIIVALIVYLFKKENYTKYEIIGYSMLLSGAIGNLIDRIIYGYVIDYLDFRLLGYYYPVFNLADICIVIGIILVIFLGGKHGNSSRNK